MSTAIFQAVNKTLIANQEIADLSNTTIPTFNVEEIYHFLKTNYQAQNKTSEVTETHHKIDDLHDEALSKLNIQVPLQPGKMNNSNWTTIKQTFTKHSTMPINKTNQIRSTKHPSLPVDSSWLNNTKTYIIRPDLCPNHTHITLIIAVESGRFNNGRRKAIRDTWWRYSKTLQIPAILAFFIGSGDGSEKSKYIQKLIYNESLSHGDIIQADFVDSYGNLTYKTMSLVHWALNFCKNFDYIIKTDDDVYMNVDNFMTLLKSTRSKHGDSFILGSVNGVGFEVVRSNDSKWYVPKERYPLRFYPPYVLGGGYAITQRAATALCQAAYSEPFFFIEDVFLTGFTRKLTNVTLVRDERIKMQKVKGASFVNDILGVDVDIKNMYADHMEFLQELAHQTVRKITQRKHKKLAAILDD